MVRTIGNMRKKTQVRDEKGKNIDREEQQRFRLASAAIASSDKPPPSNVLPRPLFKVDSRAH
jgi:hypothetical protein